MHTKFLCTNFLNTARGPGHPGKIPGTSRIPLFETQGRQSFEGGHEVFGHHPFAWKTPTPPAVSGPKNLIFVLFFLPESLKPPLTALQLKPFFFANQANSPESLEFPIRANHPICANRSNFRFARITPLRLRNKNPPLLADFSSCSARRRDLFFLPKRLVVGRT